MTTVSRVADLARVPAAGADPSRRSARARAAARAAGAARAAAGNDAMNRTATVALSESATVCPVRSRTTRTTAATRRTTGGSHLARRSTTVGCGMSGPAAAWARAATWRTSRRRVAATAAAPNHCSGAPRTRSVTDAAHETRAPSRTGTSGPGLRALSVRPAAATSGPADQPRMTAVRTTWAQRPTVLSFAQSASATTGTVRTRATKSRVRAPGGGSAAAGCSSSPGAAPALPKASARRRSFVSSSSARGLWSSRPCMLCDGSPIAA